MGVDPKKLAAFANQKKQPGKPGASPFAKMGKKGKGPLQEWAKEEEAEPEHGKGYGKEDQPESDVEAIGDRVQNGDGEPRLMKLSEGITEETNPPASITDEDIWERAKAAVEPYWDRYDEPYAVVMHVYDNMGGGFTGGKGDDAEAEEEDLDDEEFGDDGGGGA